ncbi:MAG: hypothetical protein ACI4X9_07330 [Kiritimatiellia bacterium]
MMHKEILDWIGAQSTLIVSLMGLATAIVVAWVSSGFEKDRALSARKAEIFDSVSTQVVSLAFAYQVVRSIMDKIAQGDDDSIVDAEFYLLQMWWMEVDRIRAGNRVLFRAAFYAEGFLKQSTVLDTVESEARFMRSLTEWQSLLQREGTEEDQRTRKRRLRSEVARFLPAVNKEIEYLTEVEEYLRQVMQSDRDMRRLFATCRRKGKR